jgi:hypothetical protein
LECCRKYFREIGDSVRALVNSCALEQRFERERFEHVFVGRFEADGGADSGVEGAFKRAHADAPAIAGFEAGETELGARSDEVIADGGLVEQELFIHQDAYGVFAEIVRPGVAFAVAIEACDGICATGLEDAAEYIFNHYLYRVARAGKI